MPALNTLLMLITLAVVLAAGSSAALANAYGVAISTTMIITTGMLFLAMRWRWRLPLLFAALWTGLFLIVDVSFFSANMLRVPAGGWMVLAAAAVLYGMMSTWNWGRGNLIGMLRTETLPLPTLFSYLARERVARVPGTAVFMTAPKLGVPPALQHHLRHAHALHERVILLTVENRDTPRVPPDERLVVEPLEQGFYRLFVRYGFAESPDLPRAMEAASAHGLPVDPTEVTYFIGRETLIVPPDMPWFDRAARAAVCVHVQQRPAGHRFLPHPAAPGGGNRPVGRSRGAGAGARRGIRQGLNGGASVADAVLQYRAAQRSQ